MELYDATWDYLSALPTVRQWPALKELLQRGVGSKPPHWWMAARGALATGGTLQQVLPAVVALGSLFLSIILVDDMLDDDPKGQHNLLGYGTASNMASALHALGFEAIAAADLPLERQAVIFQQLNRMMLQTALGQHLDGEGPKDEESYWHVTRTKSSPFFATSFFVGALMSGSPPEIATKLGEIGGVYGEMIQINDDLNDVLATPANPDWLQGRFPLPILYATLVPHPERERFIALRGQVSEQWALEEAQDILIRSGAISYGIDQLLQRAERIHQMLAQTPLARPAVIEEMMEALLKPVRNLLAQMSGAGEEVSEEDRRLG
jgi:geranylgeranyl pyrophosphate synthase